MKNKIVYVIIAFVVLLAFVFIYLFVIDKSEPLDDNTKILIDNIENNSTIEWSQAVMLVEQCQVEYIMQAHSREVKLNLKNDKIVRTIEPKIDDIMKVYNNNIKKCGTFPIATE